MLSVFQNQAVVLTNKESLLHLFLPKQVAQRKRSTEELLENKNWVKLFKNLVEKLAEVFKTPLSLLLRV